MFKDPHVPWPDGDFPYEVLAPAGVGPHTTHARVKDASFDLMQAGLMTAQGQDAHRSLRRMGTRLLADLLLYPVDPREAVRGALQEKLRHVQEELARPTEPPQVAAALAPGPETLGRLEEELDGVPLPRPEPPAALPDLAGQEAMGIPALADALVRFDDGSLPYPGAGVQA